MSGVSVGMVLLGITWIAVSPFVIAGIAIAAAGLAIVKLAKSLVKKCGNTKKRKKLKKTLDFCEFYDIII